jgi:NAD(P)-dependent dehydrogenase (short-subunit alcohol dehydrogenase family)
VNTSADREGVAARFDLRERVAIIVGGSNGIGLAIGRGFAEAGATVVLVGRSADRLRDAKESLSQWSERVDVIQADAAAPDAGRHLVDTVVGRYERLDILVNLASVKPTARGDMSTREKDELTPLLELNISSYYNTTRAAAPVMKRQGRGRVIYIGSVIGMKARRGVGEYGITKAAEVMMSRAFSKELGEFGITVNTIIPIFTRTEFSAKMLEDAAAVDHVLGLQSIKRIAEPEDCVGAALLLASDAGSMITGSEIYIDGGACA